VDPTGASAARAPAPSASKSTMSVTPVLAGIPHMALLFNLTRIHLRAYCAAAFL
jgi:hypothetical protein